MCAGRRTRGGSFAPLRMTKRLTFPTLILSLGGTPRGPRVHLSRKGVASRGRGVVIPSVERGIWWAVALILPHPPFQIPR